MEMQKVIRESKNQRNGLLISMAVMMVSGIDLVKMLGAIRQFWDNLGWKIILGTVFLERAFEIQTYMLFAMCGIWVAKACWRMQGLEGFKKLGSPILFTASSATTIIVMPNLPAEAKIGGSILIILTAISIVCVEVVRRCWANLRRPLRRASLVELSSEG